MGVLGCCDGWLAFCHLNRKARHQQQQQKKQEQKQKPQILPFEFSDNSYNNTSTACSRTSSITHGGGRSGSKILQNWPLVHDDPLWEEVDAHHVQAFDAAAEMTVAHNPRQRKLPEDPGTMTFATSVMLLNNAATLSTTTTMATPRETARTSRRNGARTGNEGRSRRRRGSRATAALGVSQVVLTTNTAAKLEGPQTQQLPVTRKMQKVILDSSQVKEKPGCCRCLIWSMSLDGLWSNFEETCHPQAIIHKHKVL